MKVVLRHILASLGFALLSFGLSFVSGANLVWVVGIVLFIHNLELDSLFFVVISGFIFDVLMHGYAGKTSLSVLISLVLLTLARSLGFGKNTWQKVMMIVVGVSLASLLEVLIRHLLDSGTYGTSSIDPRILIDCLAEIILMSVLSVVAWLGLGYILGRRETNRSVKI